MLTDLIWLIWLIATRRTTTSQTTYLCEVILLIREGRRESSVRHLSTSHSHGRVQSQLMFLNFYLFGAAKLLWSEWIVDCFYKSLLYFLTSVRGELFAPFVIYCSCAGRCRVISYLDMMTAGVAGDLTQCGHMMALKAVHELQRTKLDHNSWRRGSSLQFFQRLK